MPNLRSSTLAGAVATLAVLVCAAPTAEAGSVAFAPITPGELFYGDVTFRAFAGESANDLTVTSSGGAKQFSEWSDANYVIVARHGCTQLSQGKAQCPNRGNIFVRLLDGDDRARVFTGAGTPWVYGGAGADDLSSDTFGSAARVFGESGNDRVAASGDGGAVADGGAGDDEVVCCGGQDGGTAIGGAGNDLVRAGSSQPGAVNSDGGTGNDIVLATPNGGGVSNTAGGDGNDVIAIHGGGFGPTSPYTVTGGAGDDAIFGGAYDDTINGGDGRDVIDVLGGGTDTVACGLGTDVVRYDATDTIGDDCEIKLAPPDGTP